MFGVDTLILASAVSFVLGIMLEARARNGEDGHRCMACGELQSIRNESAHKRNCPLVNQAQSLREIKEAL